MYAYAKGGIKIDKTAYTGVESLYAYGEATGCMHGADRIGDLSSANGIVFGRIAGTQRLEPHRMHLRGPQRRISPSPSMALPQQMPSA